MDSKDCARGKVSGSRGIQRHSRFPRRSVSRRYPGGFFFVLKRTSVFVLLLVLGGTATAQNSKYTIFAGGSYANTNYGDTHRSNLFGWEASIEGYRYRPWLTL